MPGDEKSLFGQIVHKGETLLAEFAYGNLLHSLIVQSLYILVKMLHRTSRIPKIPVRSVDSRSAETMEMIGARFQSLSEPLAPTVHLCCIDAGTNR